MTPRDLCELWRRLLRSGASSSDMLRYLGDLDATLATPKRLPPVRRCDVPGCQRRHHSHGLCSLHVQQVRAGRDPHAEARLPDGLTRSPLAAVEPHVGVTVPKGWTP